MVNRNGASVINPLPSVFIVDDEDIIAQTLTMILQRHGFTARSFTDPTAALAAAREQAPDLVVSDVMMPEMSGVDLAIAVKTDCPECKVMLFSGHAQTLDLLTAARAKGYNFRLLNKPLHPADLLRKIREELSAWVF